MKQLRVWLDDAKGKGIRKVFIAFHAPAFARSGLGPIPEAQNPRKTIAAISHWRLRTDFRLTPKRNTKALFLTQSLHRVNLCRAQRRDITRQQC